MAVRSLEPSLARTARADTSLDCRSSARHSLLRLSSARDGSTNESVVRFFNSLGPTRLGLSLSGALLRRARLLLLIGLGLAQQEMICSDSSFCPGASAILGLVCLAERRLARLCSTRLGARFGVSRFGSVQIDPFARLVRLGFAWTLPETSRYLLRICAASH